MKTSSEGLALIRTFEGCVLTAYKCPAGVWTIGYGHTRGVKPGDKITKAQAEAYLAKDVEPAEASIWGLLGPDLIQGQFDALVSFVFNLGWKAFVGSTLCKLIRAKAPDRDVCEQLLRWHRAAGRLPVPAAPASLLCKKQRFFIKVAKKLYKYLVFYNRIATFVVSKDEKFFEFMKKSELEKRLKSLGCYLASHGKRHDKWVNRKTGTFDFVPRHADEVASGTASKILKRLAGE